MLISLHMPKTGGTSFKKLLENHYRERFVEDYMFQPLEEIKKRTERFRTKLRAGESTWPSPKPNICIHGHFLPVKYDYYLSKGGVNFITWLRDPLERLASHYYYWYRSYSEKTSTQLHRKVVKEKWSFEKFAFSKELQNYCNQFLWKFSIEDFQFVGITEFFKEDIQYFSNNFLDIEITSIPNKNINKTKTTPYHTQVNFTDKMKQFHSEDYKIYNRALEMREKRTNVK